MEEITEDNKKLDKHKNVDGAIDEKSRVPCPFVPSAQ